ncbi:MAG: hypothetical protein PHX87_03290 [Candidatus Peribacteraceae bacterium]|nr:hypothetical protein [Candidatus Peribacteraceae bacterium]MDD5742432.1 hypothetical protein [Candidatus Peribacteraceae bacterium]
MKKLLLLGLGILPLLLLAPGAHAQNYSYDCLCLYSDPRGTCREYTCDAYRTARRSYYNDYRSCDGRYDNCNYYPTNSTYRPRYWNSSNQYYDNSYYNSYNSNDYNWYYNRYNSRPSYYNYPAYNNYDYNYSTPYYY